jgi:hypothetical protein
MAEYDFDAEQHAAVGADEAFGAAEAGEAVDAAVGLTRYAPGTVRRAPARAQRAPARPLYTYMVGLPLASNGSVTATGALVAGGTSAYRVNTSFQVIDFLVVCTAGTAGVYSLSNFYIGDTNMFLGAGAVAADMFYPAVQNRGLRFTTARRGADIQIAWTFLNTTTTVLLLTMSAKVRSYFRG